MTSLPQTTDVSTLADWLRPRIAGLEGRVPALEGQVTVLNQKIDLKAETSETNRLIGELANQLRGEVQQQVTRIEQ